MFVPFVAKKSGPAISRGVVVSAGPAGFGNYVNWRVPWPGTARSLIPRDGARARFAYISYRISENNQIPKLPRSLGVGVEGRWGSRRNGGAAWSCSSGKSYSWLEFPESAKEHEN